MLIKMIENTLLFILNEKRKDVQEETTQILTPEQEYVQERLKKESTLNQKEKEMFSNFLSEKYTDDLETCYDWTIKYSQFNEDQKNMYNMLIKLNFKYVYCSFISENKTFAIKEESSRRVELYKLIDTQQKLDDFNKTASLAGASLKKIIIDIDDLKTNPLFGSTSHLIQNDKIKKENQEVYELVISQVSEKQICEEHLSLLIEKQQEENELKENLTKMNLGENAALSILNEECQESHKKDTIMKLL